MKTLLSPIACLLLLIAAVSVIAGDEASEAEKTEKAPVQDLNNLLPAKLEGFTSSGVASAELDDLFGVASAENPMDIAGIEFSRVTDNGDTGLIKAAIIQGKALAPIFKILDGLKADIDKPGKRIESIDVNGHEGLFVVKSNEDGTLRKAVFISVVADKAVVIVKGIGAVDPDEVLAVAQQVDFDGIVAALQ